MPWTSQQLLRYVSAVVFGLGVALMASSSAIHAQQSGPNIDECTSGIVDSTNGVEQTVCMYGNASYLEGYVETDDYPGRESNNYYFAAAVGSDGIIIQDFGDQCCGDQETSDGSIVPQINVWYYLNGYFDENNCNQDWIGCYWTYGNSGLSISAEVTSPPLPTITNLSPTSGAVGTSVTITGANFGASQDSSTVTFQNTPATTITSWSSTSIVAVVPVGATSGNVVVTVGGLASNGAAFTVPGTTPIVTSVNPSSGYVGLAVTISGSGFGAAEGQSTVTFNGVAAGVLSWNDSSITAVVPANATTGPVVVTLGDGEPSNNSVIFTVNASSCN